MGHLRERLGDCHICDGIDKFSGDDIESDELGGRTGIRTRAPLAR